MVKDAADYTVDGRRSRRAKTDDKLAATVREQLNDIGFSAMTIEGVCAASGVAKTTVYRRWKSKAEMVFELVLHGAEDEFPDTGSLAGDVRALAEMTVNFTASDMSQKILPGFLDAVAADPEMRQRLRDAFVTPTTEHIAAIIDRASARAELTPDTVVDVAVLHAALLGIPYASVHMLGETDTEVLTNQLAEHMLRSLGVG